MSNCKQKNNSNTRKKERKKERKTDRQTERTNEKKMFNQNISLFDKISSVLVPDDENVLERPVLRTNVL